MKKIIIIMGSFKKMIKKLKVIRLHFKIKLITLCLLLKIQVYFKINKWILWKFQEIEKIVKLAMILLEK